jgi:hypothetical protein
MKPSTSNDNLKSPNTLTLHEISVTIIQEQEQYEQWLLRAPSRVQDMHRAAQRHCSDMDSTNNDMSTFLPSLATQSLSHTTRTYPSLLSSSSSSSSPSQSNRISRAKLLVQYLDEVLDIVNDDNNDTDDEDPVSQ